MLKIRSVLATEHYILDNILDSLIMENLKMQNGINGNLDFISKAKEFCTIKLCTYRQAGHTTALVRNAIKYCDNCIILSYNHHLSENIKGVFEGEVSDKIKYNNKNTIGLNNGKVYYFRSFGDISEKAVFHRGIRLDSVMIDMASFLSKEKTDLVYKIYAPCMAMEDNKLFVFMQ